MARLLCPPLYGTRLFPLCAKQERVHFDVATNGAVGHYDGEPNQAYEEQLKQFMARMFQGWDHQSTELNYLQDWSTTRPDDFTKKFPFAIHRYNDVCFTKKEIEEQHLVQPGVIEARNTPAKADQPIRPGGFVVSGAKIRTKSDPRTSTEDLKLAKVGFQTNFNFKMIEKLILTFTFSSKPRVLMRHNQSMTQHDIGRNLCEIFNCLIWRWSTFDKMVTVGPPRRLIPPC